MSFWLLTRSLCMVWTLDCPAWSKAEWKRPPNTKKLTNHSRWWSWKPKDCHNSQLSWVLREKNNLVASDGKDRLGLSEMLEAFEAAWKRYWHQGKARHVKNLIIFNNYSSKEERESRKKQEDKGMKTRTAEHVDKTDRINDGIPLLLQRWIV